ncbi:hypothetical protein [uncultured Aeromonas sp.]|uniref:hypothetical protein n=1 Tax=uncultured Aeromonas sp. TaxID=263763 RepID=UPI0025848DA2|nr:hypothetical protein [uncultured Aeromonas sp.]
MSTIPNVNPSIETLRTDTKAAIDFVESFFSGKQQKAITNDEERRAMLEKLMVAQKTVDDVKRLDSIAEIKTKIAKHNEIYPEQQLTAADLGLNVQVVIERDGKSKATGSTKTMIPFKYITAEGEIKIGEIIDSGRVSENTGNTAEVIAFWNLVKGHKVERPDARVNPPEGHQPKMVMKTLGREEFANLTDDQLRKEFGHLVVAKA